MINIPGFDFLYPPLQTDHWESVAFRTPEYQGIWGARIIWEIGTYIYTLLYRKLITNEDLLYSAGNSTQYSVMTYKGKESKNEWIYVYV